MTDNNDNVEKVDEESSKDEGVEEQSQSLVRDNDINQRSNNEEEEEEEGVNLDGVDMMREEIPKKKRHSSSRSKKGNSKRKDLKKKSRRKKRRLDVLEPTAAEKFEIFNEELYQAQQNHHFPFMKYPLSRQAYHLMKYKNFTFQNLLSLKSYVMNHCVPYVLTYSSILFKEDLNPSLFPAGIIEKEYNCREESMNELEKQVKLLQNHLDELLEDQNTLIEDNMKKIDESLSRKETFEQKRAREKKIYQNIKIAKETCYVPLLYANDVFTVIFEFLNLSNLSNLMRVCWLFHTLVTDKVRVSVELPLNYFSKFPISDRLTYFQRIRKLHIVKDLHVPKDQHMLHYDDPFDHTATITNKIHVISQIIQIIESNVDHIESLLLPDLSGQNRNSYPYYRGRRDQRGRVREKRQSENLDRLSKKLDSLIGMCTDLRMFQSPNFFPQPIPNSAPPRWKNLELVNCRFDTKTILNVPKTVKILLLYPPRQAFDRWEWQQQERNMSLEEKRLNREKQALELVEKKEVLEKVVMGLKNLRTLRLPMILFVRDDPRSSGYYRDGTGLDDEEIVEGGGAAGDAGDDSLESITTKQMQREKHRTKMQSLQSQLRVTPEFIDFLVNSRLKSLNILTPAYYRVSEAPVYDTLMEGICQNIGTWRAVRSLKLTFLHYTMPLFFRFFSNIRKRHFKLLLFQIRNNEPMDYDYRFNLYRGSGHQRRARKTSFERIDLQYYDFSFLSKKRVTIDKLMLSITTLGFAELSKLDFLFAGLRVKYLRLGQLVPTERVMNVFFEKVNQHSHRIEKLVVLFQKWSINQFSANRALPMTRRELAVQQQEQQQPGEKTGKKEEEGEKKQKQKQELEEEEEAVEKKVSEEEKENNEKKIFVENSEKNIEDDEKNRNIDDEIDEDHEKKKREGLLWITICGFFQLLTKFVETNTRIRELHIGRDFHRKEYRHYGSVRWSVFNDLEGISKETVREFCKMLHEKKTLKKVYLPPMKRSILLRFKKIISEFEKLEKRIILEETKKEPLNY